MKRIYCLLPNMITTKKIVNELQRSNIEEKHIHVIAKPGTPIAYLPATTLMQKSDFIPAVEKGLELGGKTGLLVGLVAIALPPVSTVIAGGILLAATLAGAASVGKWISDMVGISADSKRIKEFEEAIEQGELLMLADVPHEQVDVIKSRIKQYLPDAEIEAVESESQIFSR